MILRALFRSLLEVSLQHGLHHSSATSSVETKEFLGTVEGYGMYCHAYSRHRLGRGHSGADACAGNLEPPQSAEAAAHSNDLRMALSELPVKNAILDGEIVCLDDRGRRYPEPS